MPFDNANIPESQRTRNLRKARELITPVGRWTTLVRRDHDGSMCAIGALEAATGIGDMAADTPEITLLARQVPPHPNNAMCNPRIRGMGAVAHHNNHRGHDATLKMFDDAIAESMALDAQEALA